MDNKSHDGGRQHGHHGKHHQHLRGREGKRPFDYGELRLLLLTMIADNPSHGYDLMKAIEERMGGSYSPSPGVIYPTLAWLEDMGYATIDIDQPGRKRYRITSEGEAFLIANRASADELVARVGTVRGDGVVPVPAAIIRAMENVKLALRLRLRGPLEDHSAEIIASALDAAAKTIERS
ncbi:MULTISPECIES: PadR family transcriptional regulator [unclassified Rhizobium]|uniref:PadR family transcriptional regulator n=1 Tax=unclassified Rhizobium TaxID=2613769 RepID=UPI001ADC5E5C|nr:MULTISPECIES: PadR family transcriptional regulator [unclassified Rhizobium]MBO9097659.1 PadR family transcriptional regulator [Rhizobium sp. L58/93]MBO9133559.1 PadR family transcriptional regulator [Rhizobium sp. B209b/85]MBO9167808.1 PadR family transcriptional regulator [Rhizobium sp. L245/93]MBO9183853.1 PadR family transcriptional regulator [Rhizobium sp. E27B/91]QXZ84101.1 PadR family transcriptional regulator [Rhizobium sp. K1/93]